MPRLTEAQRKLRQIERLEKSLIVLRSKKEIIDQAIADTEAKIVIAKAE